MPNVAHWQPAGALRTRAGAGGRPVPRRFVSFAFYKLGADWLRLEPAARRAGAQELAAVLDGCSDGTLTHSYTTFGMGAETDFLLWRVSDTLDHFEAMAVAMRRTRMGCCLQTPYSYLAATAVQGRPPETKGDVLVGVGRYLLVCPIVRTAPWDVLPEEERQDIMRELLRLGPDVLGVNADTTYCVGLGAQDGMLTFESDRPEQFPTLLESLRKSRSNAYVQRGTPIFTCTRQGSSTILTHISGV